MQQYKTSQEEFWAGEFGNEYISRNTGNLECYMYRWRKMANSIERLESCIEFGPNIGNNLIALERLFPSVRRKGIEINENACAELKKISGIEAVNVSILDYVPDETFDLSFTCGVLIHINPDELKAVFEKLYNSSHKYILISEYYSLNPEEVLYRGHKERLYKRDFAGEMMKQYPDLTLADYGFFYHNDSNLSEDTNWFLLQK